MFLKKIVSAIVIEGAEGLGALMSSPSLHFAALAVVAPKVAILISP